MQKKLVDEFQKTCTPFQKVFTNLLKFHELRKISQLQKYGEYFSNSINKFEIRKMFSPNLKNVD